MKHILHLVSTPIGNYKDITFRAVEILKSSELIVCEELKPARRLLSHLGIQADLLELNEHNEKEAASGIIEQILSGKKVSLISDCGTPLLSDPGSFLAELAIAGDISLVPVPGANSIIPALIASGFSTKNFYYCGWLSPKKDIRKKELLKLKARRDLLIIMETPYRLVQLLEDVVSIFGKTASICISYKITMPEEYHYRGPAFTVLNTIKNKNLKGEFVLLIENR